MTKEEQKKLQKIQLEIVDEMDRICKKYDIKYSLDGGSLLGAIRHNGFIPWDDDMDFLMTRENYNRFLEVAKKELKKEYYLQLPENEYEYPHTFIKIRKNNTLFLEKINVGKDFHLGIFIDVYPYDYAGNTKLGAKLRMFHIVSLKTLLLKKLGFPVVGKSLIQKIVISILTIFSHFCSVDKLKKNIQKQLIKKRKKTKYSANFTGMSLKAIMDTTIFDNYELHKFENKKYPIITRYDEYLTTLYGDYMTPPKDIDKEIGHSVLEINFNTKNKKGI